MRDDLIAALIAAQVQQVDQISRLIRAVSDLMHVVAGEPPPPRHGDDEGGTEPTRRRVAKARRTH